MNNIEKTIKDDLCINCGICKTVCKFNSITMQKNKYGELQPKVNEKLCRQCGMCLKYCPNSKEKFENEAKKVSSTQTPHTYGLQNAQYYLAWNSDKIQRQKSCSGGAITKFALYLFETGKIDGMIHVERLWGKRGDLHYGARLSSSVSEIKENVSSAYQPIDFSSVLTQLEKGKTYLVTGTPCIIRGIKNLFMLHPDFREIKIITAGLVCSHNVNSRFVDFLSEMNKINETEEWQINIRSKDDTISDANNFKNNIYTKNGTDLLNKNRFESGWTNIWRSYYFAMGACLKCSDFWGYEADISVKDAWGEWANDPLGKSIVLIRNSEISEYFLNSGINYEKLNWDKIENHQSSTSCFKQTEAYNKNFKSVFSRENRKNGMFRYYLISKSSKFLYKNFGYKITEICMPIVKLIGYLGEKL